MAKFRVCITDETGKAVFDQDVSAMVASVVSDGTPIPIILRGEHEDNLLAMNFVDVAMEAMYKED